MTADRTPLIIFGALVFVAFITYGNEIKIVKIPQVVVHTILAASEMSVIVSPHKVKN